MSRQALTILVIILLIIIGYLLYRYAGLGKTTNFPITTAPQSLSVAPTENAISPTLMITSTPSGPSGELSPTKKPTVSPSP